MRRMLLSVLLGACAFAAGARAEVSEITITRGDGVGFLPLNVMEKFKLVEKHAEQAGAKLTVNWGTSAAPASSTMCCCQARLISSRAGRRAC